MDEKNGLHYQKVTDLVEESLFSTDFYSFFFLGSNSFKERLVKNLIEELEYVLRDFYSFKNNDIVFTEEYPISDEEINWEKIKELLLKKLGKKKNIKKVKEKIADYIRLCEDFVQRVESFQKIDDPLDKMKLVYFLYGFEIDEDECILEYDIINYTLNLFNEFCLSFLKGEYVVIDSFSEGLLQIEDKLQVQKIKNEVWKFWEQARKEEEELGELVTTDQLSENEKLISVITKKIERLQSRDLNFKKLIAPVLFYNKDWDFYDDFLSICHEYFIFNRRIDTFIHQEFKTRRVQYYFEAERRYEEDSIKAYRKFFTQDWSTESNILCVSQMLPCLFRKILDMGLVDHNFISSEENFRNLLKLEELLWGIPVNRTVKECQVELGTFQGFFSVLEKLKTSEKVSGNLIDNLFKTLQLIDYKNRMLIYKIIKRAGDGIKLYEYIGLKYVLIFTDQENKRKFHLEKGLKDYKVCEEEKNDLLKENSYFYVRKSDESLFLDYENIYLGILSNGYDYQKYLKDYRRLEEVMKERNSISLEEQKDIRKYNETILINLVQQFVGYGFYIKKLKLLEKQEEPELYLNKVLSFLKRQEKTEVLSCSFIREHIRWGLAMLKEKSRQEKADLTFNYITLVNRLLQLLGRLIDHITTDHYCMNFSPLFQDCFYECSFSNQLTEVSGHQMFAITEIKRVKERNGVHFWKEIKDKNVVFMSSAWQPPVNIYQLKKEYREGKEQFELLSTEFYNNYFRQILQKRLGSEIQKMNGDIKERENSLTGWVKQELDDNKRTSVQILGIFAAFLALATISLGSFLHMQGYKDYLKVMFSLTICLGIFVVLLHFVVNRKYNKPFMNLVNLLTILLTILFLGGLLIFWG